MKILSVIYYDHFSSDEPLASHCLAFACGILLEESDMYYKLLHILADINDPNAAQESHCFREILRKKMKISSCIYAETHREHEVVEQLWEHPEMILVSLALFGIIYLVYYGIGRLRGND